VSTEAAVYEVLRGQRQSGFDDGWCSFPRIAVLVELELGRRCANSTLRAALGRLKRSGRIEQRIDGGPGRTAWWRWVGP
jgi:hypothetical protein